MMINPNLDHFISKSARWSILRLLITGVPVILLGVGALIFAYRAAVPTLAESPYKIEIYAGFLIFAIAFIGLFGSVIQMWNYKHTQFYRLLNSMSEHLIFAGQPSLEQGVVKNYVKVGPYVFVQLFILFSDGKKTWLWVRPEDYTPMLSEIKKISPKASIQWEVNC